jgi:Cu(I)/Ag(I) efflux system membrane fusion protein
MNTTANTSTLRTVGLVALGLAAGVGGTLLLRPRSAATAASPAAPATEKKAAYQCPMHPQIIQDHPGTCPICGMALVPMEGGSEQSALDSHATVTIDLERQQLIGLKTAEVREGPVGGELRTTGRVTVDETRVRKVNVKVEGFVERLFVDFTGKPVANGQPLFTLYSPELLAAQNEFLLALRTRKALQGSAELAGSGEDLVASARRRLALWDVPPAAVESLERTGQPLKALTIHSPVSGVVTAKNVVEGARLGAGDVPFEITDLSRVWVQADLYEAELARIPVGTPAELRLQALPGTVVQGRVAFVDPALDPRTRAARLRLEFDNPGGRLKPEMYGEVVLRPAGRVALLVPKDAVLDAGAAKVAFVSLGQGKFEPREVSLGADAGDKVEVLGGLEPADEVVVGANFLVDSESRLKAALARMGRASKPGTAPAGAKPAAGPAGHQH